MDKQQATLGASTAHFQHSQVLSGPLSLQEKTPYLTVMRSCQPRPAFVMCLRCHNSFVRCTVHPRVGGGGGLLACLAQTRRPTVNKL